jgi:hypothetical protein
LKLSPSPFSVAFRNRLGFVAMNFEPWSLRYFQSRCPGTPRDRIAAARRSRTCSPDIERRLLHEPVMDGTPA